MKKIEEIAKLAKEKAINENLNETEVFANMIIEKCIEVISNESMNSGDEWEDGLKLALTAIKTEFLV